MDRYYVIQQFESWGARAYVGPNFQYYERKWGAAAPNYDGMFASWNWAAFFLGAYWMFYRKMFTYGLAYMAARIVLVFLFGSFSYLFTLAATIFIALYGNALYCKKAFQEVGSALYQDPQQAHQIISAKGGTSGWGLALFFIVESVSFFVSCAEMLMF